MGRLSGSRTALSQSQIPNSQTRRHRSTYRDRDKAGSKRISFCRLYEKANTAEIEYCIGKAFWNNGYITEAVKAFIEYTFQNTIITKLEAFHRIENPASGKVMQKAGKSRNRRNFTVLCGATLSGDN